MHKVFYSEHKPNETGVTLGHMIRTRPTSGDIGIEIECEGNTFRKDDLPHQWIYHKDGSLRGKDNAEYVFKKPLKFGHVETAIRDLWQMFETDGTELDNSNRTSVHVHLNMQKFYLNRLCAFVSLYFAVEEILVEWCGDHRVGNLFCLRGRDATAIVSNLKKFMQTNGRYEIREGMHYAGLNAQALYKFGSIEIRTMRGVSDPQTILDWVAILERIYVLSADYPDPRVIPSLLSSEGPQAFLDLVLGDKAHLVRSTINYNPSQIREALYDGIRLAQDLCYCRDWSTYVTDGKMDPFAPSKIKLISALLAEEYPSIHPPAMSPGETVYEVFDPSTPAASNEDFALSDPYYSPEEDMTDAQIEEMLQNEENGDED